MNLLIFVLLDFYSICITLFTLSLHHSGFLSGALFCLLVPPVYERHQDVIDEKVALAHSILSKHLNTVISKTGQPKQKKAE